MDPIAPLIKALHSEGRLRVWSLVITVFGDLVQHRGGRISTARLGRILQRVGVEKGAMRTALSRLGRDGWVHSERAGKTSIYRLSAAGIASFETATAQIYAPVRTGDVGVWTLSLRLDAGNGDTVTLRPTDQMSGAADCVITGKLQSVSDRYKTGLLAPSHRCALEALARDIDTLRTPPADPLDAAAARMLLIHRWRRIVLRFEEIPEQLMPRESPLANPRARVAGVYSRLIPAAEAWLDDDSDGLEPLPPARTGVQNRFA